LAMVLLHRGGLDFPTTYLVPGNIDFS